MTDLPEKIKAWLWNGQTNSGQWHVNGVGETTAYIREDVALAMVATVIEECLDRISDSDPALSDQMRSECTDKADWQAAKDALDRLIKEAVEKERERCLRIVEAHHDNGNKDGDLYMMRAAAAIRRGDDD